MDIPNNCDGCGRRTDWLTWIGCEFLCPYCEERAIREAEDVRAEREFAEAEETEVATR